ncbi:hypothetical protein BD413DRAFT_527906 [Trametes elegans]|nr:hypothetical protein BD413DRAFT_527906 [Trametes elegans]
MSLSSLSYSIAPPESGLGRPELVMSVQTLSAQVSLAISVLAGDTCDVRTSARARLTSLNDPRRELLAKPSPAAVFSPFEAGRLLFWRIARTDLASRRRIRRSTPVFASDIKRARQRLFVPVGDGGAGWCSSARPLGAHRGWSMSLALMNRDEPCFRMGTAGTVFLAEAEVERMSTWDGNCGMSPGAGTVVRHCHLHAAAQGVSEWCVRTVRR